jgi:hypothetical protein
MYHRNINSIAHIFTRNKNPKNRTSVTEHFSSLVKVMVAQKEAATLRHKAHKVNP